MTPICSTTTLRDGVRGAFPRSQHFCNSWVTLPRLPKSAEGAEIIELFPCLILAWVLEWGITGGKVDRFPRMIWKSWVCGEDDGTGAFSGIFLCHARRSQLGIPEEFALIWLEELENL